jgi:hypothetical protein
MTDKPPLQKALERNPTHTEVEDKCSNENKGKNKSQQIST